MQYLERLIIASLILLSILSCQSNRTYENEEEVLDYFIEWDNASLVCIADEGGYPRLIRLNNGSLLVVYENRRGGCRFKN